ncbi:MAG: S9 family peptidase, partial [Clostridia bacterium]
HGSQAWLLKLDGGEAVRLTHFRRGITSLRWSPDGATLFGLVSAPFDGDVETFDSGLSEKEARTQFEKEDKEWAEGAKRYRHLYYKMNGIGLRNHRAAQLVAVDVKTGAFRQLTRGEMPVSAPAVSLDGSQVAFVSNRHPNREIEQQEHQHVYIVPTAGGELRLLTDKVSARDAAWSPDGRYLAVFGSGEELYRYRSAVQTKLFLVSADGSSVEDLTDGFPDSLSSAVGSDLHADGSAPGPIWSADGRAVFAISGREGRAEVVRIPVGADGRRAGPIGAVIGGDREVYAFATLDGRRFVALYGTPTSPSQVVTVDVPAGEGGRPRPHRAVTAAMEEEPVPAFPAGAVRLDADNAWLSEVELSEPRPFWYTSADDWRAEGWVIPPPGFEPGRKYPVVLEIHGGPQTCYGYQMFHEMQWLAAQGYAVVYTNPRGSTSYGQEFVNAVRLHYGENDMVDIMNGLDAALEQFDFLDPERVAVTGGSYGGYMTNWIVGHSTRFFAAVAQRSISNWISFYGASDIGPGFVEHQLGVATFDSAEKRELLWEKSPLAYVAEVKTPLLLIHAEEDLRCPMEQAEQFYTAIKRHGGEVELFRVPQASHELSRSGKPKLRLQRLQALYD